MCLTDQTNWSTSALVFATIEILNDIIKKLGFCPLAYVILRRPLISFVDYIVRVWMWISQCSIHLTSALVTDETWSTISFWHVSYSDAHTWVTARPWLASAFDGSCGCSTDCYPSSVMRVDSHASPHPHCWLLLLLPPLLNHSVVHVTAISLHPHQFLCVHANGLMCSCCNTNTN